MRITQEADYAIRICATLAQTKHAVGSPQLSEQLSIPTRFTSKILRKLLLAGLVKSIRGVNGGFTFAVEPETVTLRCIIETIDGPIAIRHCLLDEYNCSYQKDKGKCRFHCMFEELNRIIMSRLEMFTLADMIDVGLSAHEMIKRFDTTQKNS